MRQTMDKSARIYVAGENTLIGAAILRELSRQGYHNLLAFPEENESLIRPDKVDNFFRANQPDYVFLAAGKSAGIGGNQKYPADLMLNNLLVSCHLIDAAWQHGVKKLLYVASSCIYPKYARQPMQVESLMTGALEPTNEAYATAKIAGIKLCQAYCQQYGANFITAIPANPYGPGDHFDPQDAHVIPSLITKMHQAKVSKMPRLEIWGSGNAQREFIFVDDLANAIIHVMNTYENTQPINVGSGKATTIRDLAFMIKAAVGYQGELYFDTSKPDGFPLKSLDSIVLSNSGWQPLTTLEAGIAATYQWYLNNKGVHY